MIYQIVIEFETDHELDAFDKEGLIVDIQPQIEEPSVYDQDAYRQPAGWSPRWIDIDIREKKQ